MDLKSSTVTEMLLLSSAGLTHLVQMYSKYTNQFAFINHHLLSL